jgi:hypothetical protein
MRKINDTDKQIISNILQQDVLNMPIVISYIKNYFKKNNTAIFILSSAGKAYILYKNQGYYKKAIKLIVDIISLLEFLDKEGYIYCIPADINQPYFIYESSEIYVGINDDDSYTISNGKLEIKGETADFYDSTHTLILGGICCPKELADKILYYFKCIIYPTESLKDLVRNNFETLEVISYKREIKEAKISRNFAWAALIISLLLPFGMTFFNNRFAKTEITDYQYIEVLRKMENISEKLNYISNSQPKDTISPQKMNKNIYSKKLLPKNKN